MTLERVPADKLSAGSAPIRLAAWILPAPDDRVRLLVGELCLDVAIDSVLRIDPAAPNRPAEVPVAAMVELAPRAQVLNIGPAAVWREFFQAGPRPFALAARPAKVLVEGHEAYLKREITYLRHHGLDRSSDRDQT